VSLVTIIIIVLLLLAVFGAPTWGYSRNWGYGWMPTYGLGAVVLILIILLLLGILPNRTL
jgi:Protein of unknown function (DUF3309)